MDPIFYTKDDADTNVIEWLRSGRATIEQMEEITAYENPTKSKEIG